MSALPKVGRAAASLSVTAAVFDNRADQCGAVKVSVLLSVAQKVRKPVGGGSRKKGISKLDMSIALGFLILKLQNPSTNLRHGKSLGGDTVFVKISETPGGSCFKF